MLNAKFHTMFLTIIHCSPIYNRSSQHNTVIITHTCFLRITIACTNLQSLHTKINTTFSPWATKSHTHVASSRIPGFAHAHTTQISAAHILQRYVVHTNNSRSLHLIRSKRHSAATWLTWSHKPTPTSNAGKSFTLCVAVLVYDMYFIILISMYLNTLYLNTHKCS